MVSGEDLHIVAVTARSGQTSLSSASWGAAATWCILSLHDAPIAGGHSICGPWGCGPTIPALLSAHGFWLMVAIPASLWAGKRLTGRRVVAVGWVCLALGMSGIAAVSLVELMNWARGHSSRGPILYDPTRPVRPGDDGGGAAHPGDHCAA